ncbi:MAG: hypothetical protein Q8M19_24485 [Reyranella sp.]|nr:hypothetical protein [Reyranella sp.]
MTAPIPTPNDKRAAVLAALPKHLRTLAFAVRRIGNGRDPEATALFKDEIATTLTSLAALLEVEEGSR